MAKYIIDVPDNTQWIQWMNVSEKDGHAYFDYKAPEDLTPYVRSESYIDGLKKGQNEVWEFAKKVRLRSFFDDNHNLQPYLDYFDSYQEAKAKHEELKKFENEIRVGDEVEYSCLGGTHRFVVFGVESTIVGNTAYGFKYPCDYNDVGEYCKIDMLTKTGRHFPEVEELLKKMKKESYK